MRARLSICLPILLMCVAQWAQADVAYTYTGNYFNNILAGTTYTTSDRVTATFTTASPLIETSFTDVTGLLTGYNMSDGVHTFTNLDSFGGLMLQTDATGTILSWNFGAESPAFAAIGTTVMAVGSSNTASDIADSAATGPCGTLDVSGHCAGLFPEALGIVVNDPGTWQVTAVPEPASIALLGTGLFGLATAIRRKLHR